MNVGVDASRIMVDIMEALWDLDHQWNMRYRDKIFGSGGYPIPNDKQGVGTMGIVFSLIEAGEYIGSIPGHAEIEGQVYYPPNVDDEELWEEMQNVVEKVALSNDWMKENPPLMNWKEEFDWPPFSVPHEHPGVETLGESVEDVTREEPILSGFKAVCDNAQIQRECGVDAISFGPGDISMGAHGPDEYIPLDQFMEAAKVYASMIINWCNQSS
jgi:acetylornithine deacetylase